MDPCTSGVNITSSNTKSKTEMKRLKDDSREFQIETRNKQSLEDCDKGNSAALPTMEQALDNHLVLQEIFKYLSPGDLRNCCRVNEKWQAVAGPMIFEYHLYFDERLNVQVTTTSGYLNPHVKRRCFSIEAETKYLEAQKRGVGFISLKFSEIHSWYRTNQKSTSETRMFVKKFGPVVYKVDCYDDKSLDKFFMNPDNHKRHRNLLRGMKYFPNCEELHSRKILSFKWFWQFRDCCQLTHLKRLYLGSMGLSTDMFHYFFSPEPILRAMPNIHKIHGVPFTSISSFEERKKLDLVYSIRYHLVMIVGTEVEEELPAMRTMVQLGLTFRFLRIGHKRAPWKINSKFIDRCNEQFENLLELGKDTLDSLILFSNRKENQINFPARMTALTHITFRRGYTGGTIHFPRDFNFAERFPKLNTISFMPLTLSDLKETETWWGTNGMPGTTEFRKAITNLRCTAKLGKSIEEKLLQRFPSVSCIEYCTIDDTEVDGIISE